MIVLVAVEARGEEKVRRVSIASAGSRRMAKLAAGGVFEPAAVRIFARIDRAACSPRSPSRSILEKFRAFAPELRVHGVCPPFVRQ
jgi:hypothetical protein